MKKDIQAWVVFLTDQFSEEYPPTEYRTMAGRTLSVDDGKSTFDVEFSENGQFQRLISYKQERRR